MAMSVFDMFLAFIVAIITFGFLKAAEKVILRWWHGRK